MKFRVIDKTTGEYPTVEVLEQIAKENHFHYSDIDSFLLDEDGYLYLSDDCGRFHIMDMDRFKVEVIE